MIFRVGGRECATDGRFDGSTDRRIDDDACDDDDDDDDARDDDA